MTTRKARSAYLFFFGTFLATLVVAADQVPVSAGRDGRLVYIADASGNRIPDFSVCGYQGGDRTIPDVPIKVVVDPAAGNNTARIQAALDYVSAMPPDQDGFRGAVLLRKGKFEIQGRLKINASGVVLRGSGSGPEGTILLAAGHDRRTLIEVSGRNDRKEEAGVAVTDAYVPVNATKLHLGQTAGFRPGDTVSIRRPSTREWMEALGFRDRGDLDPVPPGENRPDPTWRPGTRDVVWDRTVREVSGNAITLDVPLTAALDAKYGGGMVAAYSWPGRISGVGVENLQCESAFDAANPKDESHAWFAITMANVQDAWVRQVTVRHFAGSAVAVWETCRRVTVEDCKSLAPVSEIGGWRRNAFFTIGQQVLMQRLFSEEGHHDFAVGFTTPGPNAFVQCVSLRSTGESGSIDSWACGTLFDLVQIDGAALTLRNRGYRDQGSHWAAANSMIWNSLAPVIECSIPPTAQNWAIGTWGEFSGDGAAFFGAKGGVPPRSLYYAQLSDRLGADALRRAQLMPPLAGVFAPAGSKEASKVSSPAEEEVSAFNQLARQPAPTMSDWIDLAAERQPIPIQPPTGALLFATLPSAPPPVASVPNPLRIQNGLLVANGKFLTGGRAHVPMCFGGVRPYNLKADAIPSVRPAVTRFVPGRTGHGLTDDLEEVIAVMRTSGQICLEQNYALWYDRRRDYHDNSRRMDGDVVAPFYEVPFARSGQGTAWDGLSKYDLTKYNPWYWDRLADFAGLCDRNGLVLIYDHYFQHNILEVSAHYADFAWRTTNNINATGFPEPPNYAGDIRVFMAGQFYDVTDPGRRALHQSLIRKGLENFAGNTNVIHLIGAEFTGPLDFMRLWIDTILSWQKEQGKTAMIGLSCTKDVQDAILADQARSSCVSVIDIRYWWPQAGGGLYAPPGGKSLAPRQWEHELKVRKPSFDGLVKVIREYRKKYPDKAVIYSGEASDTLGWAVIFGGGSLPELKKPLDPRLAAVLPDMKPVDLPGAPADQFAIGIPDQEYLIYVEKDAPAGLDLNLYTQQHPAKDVVWLSRKKN